MIVSHNKAWKRNSIGLTLGPRDVAACPGAPGGGARVAPYMILPSPILYMVYGIHHTKYKRGVGRGVVYCAIAVH